MTNASESAPPSPAPTSEPAPKRFQCRHILTSGRRCRSASLRGEQFCYYHHTTRRPAPRHRGVHPEHAVFELSAIDDREGIHFAIAQVLARLTTAQLDPRRANPILYALKLAIWNLHEPRSAAARTDTRTSRNSTRGYHCSSPASRGSAAAGNSNPPQDFVEEIILDEDLGPIAPIAEIRPPEAAKHRLSLLERMMQEFGPPTPIPQPNPIPNPAQPNPIPDPTQRKAPTPQSEALIPTGGGDLAAAVDELPHFASNLQPATDNLQPATVLPTLQASVEAESPSPRIIEPCPLNPFASSPMPASPRAGDTSASLASRASSPIPSPATPSTHLPPAASSPPSPSS